LLTRWDEFGRWQILCAVARLAPSATRHVALRPYRRQLFIEPYEGPLGGLGRRLYCGLLDATVALLVTGYGELTGHRLRSVDGAVAVMFIRVLSALDDEIDRRLVSGESLALDDVLQGPIVSVRIRSWQDFARRFAAYGSVMRRYWEVGREHFAPYVARLSSEQFRRDTQAQLAAMRIDSGQQLQWLVRTWAAFNGHPLSERALGEFFALGVGGKLADDLADFRMDVANESVNLLYALLTHHQAEFERATSAVWAHSRLDLNWWREHCPETFEEFSRHFFEHYDLITAPSLRRACYLMVLPVVGGLARVSRR